MAWTRFVGMAFLSTILLGNVCLLQMAGTFSQSPQLEAISMSRADAQECPWVRLGFQSMEPNQKSPCESGRCIKIPTLKNPGLAQKSHEVTTPTLPVPLGSHAITTTLGRHERTPLVERPPPLLALATVVLRE